MNEQGKHVLDGDSCVAFVYLGRVDLSAYEDELDENDGSEVEDSATVVIEQEEFGMIEDFASLY